MMDHEQTQNYWDMMDREQTQNYWGLRWIMSRHKITGTYDGSGVDTQLLGLMMDLEQTHNCWDL